MNDKFYCAAPWRGLHINPTGDVKTCCAGNPKMLGNLNQSSIEEIINSPKLQEIRNSIKQGIPHEYCSNCVQAERYGNSERHWHNKVNREFDIHSDNEYIPTLIDIRWNTTCNLSCNYCNEWCSSKWAYLKGMTSKSGTVPYYEQVCEFLNIHKEHIKEVALVGGEPLLLPENEMLLDVVPKDAVITLITNLSLDLQKNKIFNKLADRKRVGWFISIDNIGDQFEYVRYGTNWEQMQTNINTIKEFYNKGHWAGFQVVYSIYNATRINEFLDWALPTGIPTTWQSLFHPNYLDPLYFNDAIKNLIKQEIEVILQRDDINNDIRDFFTTAKENFNNANNNSLEAEFKKHIDEIENKYHKPSKDFKSLWPELSELL